jgi:hypothetical protein
VTKLDNLFETLKDQFDLPSKAIALQDQLRREILLRSRCYSKSWENCRPNEKHRLIDTRSEVPGISLGILVSIHPDVMAAFAANDTFQKTEASGRHIRTKIVTLN